MLSKYGEVGVAPHGSHFLESVNSSIPGLIFTKFTATSYVDFHFLYIYNQYLNETTTGIPITNLLSNQAVYLGLEEVKNMTPSWVYNIVYTYQVETKTLDEGNGSVALYAHHLVTMCVITGPKGTWAFILYPNPLFPSTILRDFGVSRLTPLQAQKEAQLELSQMAEGKVPSSILQASDNLINVIKEAE